MNLLLAVHAATTWFMVGLIWTIQLVHYPLFDRVGEDAFARYEAEHVRRMGRLLAVPAPIEVVTAAALVIGRPPGVGLGLVLVAGAVLAAVWITTALVQVPLHDRLAAGPSSAATRRLVTSNRMRTAGWTLRGALVGVMVWQACSSS
jgi:hypothetical protein